VAPGASARPIVALIIVLCVHQFFEGIALGSYIADLRELASRSAKLLMSLLFALTVPVGCWIGIGVASAYKRDSVASIWVTGSLSGLTGGGGLRGLVDAVTGQDDVKTAIGKLLGGVDPAAVRQRLATADPAELTDKATRERYAVMGLELDTIVSQYNKSSEINDPQARAKQQQQLLDHINAIRNGGAPALATYTQALKDAHIDENQLEDALAGKIEGVSPLQAQRLVALRLAARGVGLDETAERAGIALGGRVSTDQTRAAYNHFTQADAAELRGDTNDAARLRKGFYTRAGQLAQDFSRDTKSMTNLGAGGLDLIKNLEGSYGALQQLARDNGLTLEELTASTDADIVQKRAKLEAPLAQYVKALQERQTEVDANGVQPISDDERAAIEAHKAASLQDDTSKNRESVQKLVAATRGSLNNTEIADLAKILGTGDVAAQNRKTLESRLAGLQDFEAFAYGFGRENVRKAILRGDAAGLDMEQLPFNLNTAKQFQDAAGGIVEIGPDTTSGALGATPEVYRELLKNLPANPKPGTLTPPQAATETKDKVTKLTGTVTVKNDGTLEFTDVTGVDSTPVMTA
jgi:hypothetical protein